MDETCACVHRNMDMYVCVFGWVCAINLLIAGLSLWPLKTWGVTLNQIHRISTKKYLEVFKFTAFMLGMQVECNWTWQECNCFFASLKKKKRMLSVKLDTELDLSFPRGLENFTVHIMECTVQKKMKIYKTHSCRDRYFFFFFFSG